MSNFTNLIVLLKARFSTYLEEICQGFSIPEKKLIRDLSWGVLKSSSTVISQIARSLQEQNTLDSVETRLTNGIKNFYYPKLVDRLAEHISKVVSSPIKVCVDESDLNKEQSRKLEDLCKVKDGSKNGEVFVNGYHITGITIVGGNENYVFPICMDIYSSQTNGYTSIYDQTTGKLSYPITVLEKEKINSYISFDRGYDDEKFVNYCDNMGVFYVIRAKVSRKYDIGGMKLTIEQIGQKYKGKYTFKYKNQEGENVTTKAGAVKAYHKDLGELYIVFEKHSKSDIRYYLTNIKQSNRNDCALALKTYRIRWRIEEIFRFIKQSYRFENMLIRTLNAMNVMSAIILFVINFMTELMIEKSSLYDGIKKAWPQFKSAEIRKQKRKELGQYGFEYYSFQQGIVEVLKHSSSVPKIKKRIRKKQAVQMTIFDMYNEN